LTPPSWSNRRFRSSERPNLPRTPGLSAITHATWFTKVNPSAFTYAIWAAMLIGIFVFGGQGRFGLVKPFLKGITYFSP
jgi:hypothetical protein